MSRKQDAYSPLYWTAAALALWYYREYIEKWLHPTAFGGNLMPGPASMREGEAIWQVPWDKIKTSWNAWQGDKPYAISTAITFPLTLLQQPEPAGRITFNSAGNTRRQRGSGGRWVPPPTVQISYGNAGPVSALIGDPRALYCLDKLCTAGQVTQINHLGMSSWNPKNGFWGHDDGCAIDLVGDDTMNRIVHAAINLKMPIAWVSSTPKKKANGNLYWPIFALKNGEKIEVGSSNSNHNSHYHLVLPRPQWALSFCIWEAYRPG